MSQNPTPVQSRRARQIVEVVMALEGVRRVRVWELGERVEIGVDVSPGDTAADVLHRVREATEAMRGPDEEWDVGMLAES